MLRGGEAASSCDPGEAERVREGVSGGVEMSSASPRRRQGDKCPRCSFSSQTDTDRQRADVC